LFATHDPTVLSSFPTRRSSDLRIAQLAHVLGQRLLRELLEPDRELADVAAHLRPCTCQTTCVPFAPIGSARCTRYVTPLTITMSKTCVSLLPDCPGVGSTSRPCAATISFASVTRIA